MKMSPDLYVTIRPAIKSLIKRTATPSFVLNARSGNDSDVFIFIASNADDIKNFNGDPRTAINIPGKLTIVNVGSVKGMNSLKAKYPSIVDTMEQMKVEITDKTQSSFKTLWNSLFNKNYRIYYCAVMYPKDRSDGAIYSEELEFLPFLFGNASESSTKSTAASLFTPQDDSSGLSGWLKVDGNKIISDDQKFPFILRGVNWSGLNYAKYYNPFPFDVQFDNNFQDDQITKTIKDFFNDPNKSWRSSVNELTQLKATEISKEKLINLRTWGCNVIRVPLNIDFILNGFNEDLLTPKRSDLKNDTADDQLKKIKFQRAGIKHCGDLDLLIQMAGDAGIRIILVCDSLRMIDSHQKDKPITTADWLFYFLDQTQFQPCLPTNQCLLFWSVIASRYQNCKHVMYDILGEPHDLNSDSPYQKKFYTGIDHGSSITKWTAAWVKWVRIIHELITTVNKNALIFVSGFGGDCWSASFETMMIPIVGKDQGPLNNIVYSSHWYYRGWSAGKLTGRSTNESLGKCLHITEYDQQGISAKVPVFFGEWGTENFEAMTLDKPISPKNKDSIQISSDASQILRKKWGTATPRSTDPQELTYKKLAEDNAYIPKDELLADYQNNLLGFFKKYGLTKKGSYGGLAGFTAWGYSDAPHLVFRQKPYFDGKYISNADQTNKQTISMDKDPGDDKKGTTPKTITPTDLLTAYGQTVVKEMLRVEAIDDTLSTK
jgi:hypothetical protein